LRPFSVLFGLLVRFRVALYRAGWLPVRRLSCPVIVVGNITVGGTGKTPLVLWLYRWLEEQGWRPGVITRGYGGKASRWPQRVTADSDPVQVGDEPVLLAKRGVERIAVGPDRVASGQLLIQDAGCDIVICDDGLQHYRLGRDVEIAVIDASRGLGNGYLLPAGPLREPAVRLKDVDFEMYNGAHNNGGYCMELSASQVLPVDPRAGRAAQPLSAFEGRHVHAVAGIGNPARFFDMLRRSGIEVTAHALPDHHSFGASDLEFGENTIVLMTEKDAVKCVAFDQGTLWFVPVDAQVGEGFESALLESLKALK
jgi:tetraacyldisaccharide 4'-kinase